MYKFLYTLLLLILYLTHYCSGQISYPVPFDLNDANYYLTKWDSSSVINPAGTYPPNIMFHQTSKIDPAMNDSMTSDWHCPYNLESKSRIIGLGERGIGFINTSQI
ncbi:MAG: hypothetical protein WCT77_14815, partial [Bacteroidota bacterium]